MAEVEFQVSDRRYRVGAMSALDAINIARRLGGVAAEFAAMVGRQDDAENPSGAAEMASRVMRAFGAMTDEDTNFVMNKCLASVTMQAPGGGAWAPMFAANGLQMFPLSPFETMKIASKVVEVHIVPFFLELLTEFGARKAV